MATLTNRIREYRAHWKYTQEQLANLVGVRRETILHIEHNRFAPSLTLAFKIARAFNAGVEDIFIWGQD